MELIEYDFQTQAENRLYDRIQSALLTSSSFALGANGNGTPEQRSILLSSPVASGKTKMVGATIDRLAGQYSNLAYIFITPSTGGLSENAYEEFKDYGLKNVRVYDIDECVLESDSNVPSRSLTVLGWSDIHSSKKNVQMQIGETPTLRSVLESNKTPIVLFVDEAHSNRTGNTELVKSLIDPICTVEVTATPHVDQYAGISSDDMIVVEPSDVAVEGKIKSHIVVNDAGEPESLMTSGTWDGIITAGMKRRNLLDAESRGCGMSTVHLLVIQLPNDASKADTDSKDSEHMLENMHEAKRILKKHGATDDEIIVWLAGQHDVEPTQIKNTEHKYLITKLAVAQGWNCPRANPWAKIREKSESDTLDAQTLGRFMRTENPQEWRVNEKYRNDAMLNTAYVYTADEDYDASLRGYSIRDERFELHLRDDFRKRISDVRLVKIKAGARIYDSADTTESIKDVYKLLSEHKDWAADSARRRITKTDFETVRMYGDIKENGKAYGEHGLIDVSKEDARRYLYRFMIPSSRLRRYPNVLEDVIKPAVMKLAASMVGSDKPDDSHEVGLNNLRSMFSIDFTVNMDKDEAEKRICCGIINNFDEFADNVASVLTEHSEYSPDEIDKGDDGALDCMYKIPETMFAGINIIDDVPDNYVYDKMDSLGRAYADEKDFEDTILSKHTDWWLKNGTTDKESFQIAWTDANGARRKFFPDFIASKNGKILILEVKGGYANGESNVLHVDDDKAKCASIYRYMHDSVDGRSSETAADISVKASHASGMLFGVCRKINGEWKIYDGNGSDYEDVYCVNWSRLLDAIGD